MTPDTILYLDEEAVRQACACFDPLAAVRERGSAHGLRAMQPDDRLIALVDAPTSSAVALLASPQLHLLAGLCTAAAAAAAVFGEAVVTAGLLGDPDRAEQRLRILAAALPALAHAAVWVPHPLRARLAAARLAAPPGLAVTVTGSARQAVLGADLVLVACTAPPPPSWLAPDALVLAERADGDALAALAAAAYAAAARHRLGVRLPR